MAKIAITDLLEAGVHFGHQTKRWNPKMKPYIYGTRNGITIFDLTVTMRHLAEACDFLQKTVADGKDILFVGTKRQAQETVREVAQKTGMPFMCDRWPGGTLTNNNVVKQRISYLKKLRDMDSNDEFKTMPKKEVANLRREMGKLERALGGIVGMNGTPGAMVVVDVTREGIAVKEATKLNIPVIALVDSNCNPDMVDYVVPGNDDALKSIKVIMDAFSSAIELGGLMSKREKVAAKEAAELAKKEADDAKDEAKED
jgi:small subunit ribosomal protein S2